MKFKKKRLIWILLVVIDIYLITIFLDRVELSMKNFERVNASNLALSEYVALENLTNYDLIKDIDTRVENKGNRRKDVEIVDLSYECHRVFQNANNQLDSMMALLATLPMDGRQTVFTLKDIDNILNEPRAFIEENEAIFYDRIRHQSFGLSDFLGRNESMINQDLNVSVGIMRMILINLKSYLSTSELRLIDEFSRKIGLADLSFDTFSPEGIVAQRGSRSRAVQQFDTASFFIEVVENEFIDTELLETAFLYPVFSVDAYDHFKDAAKSGVYPVPSSIQINELVNYFDYDLPANSREIVTVSSEIQPCPWNSENYLLMLALQGKKNTQNKSIAKDVNLETTFEKEAVENYRLLGQEGVFFDYLDPQPAEFPSGESLIVFYELKPTTPFEEGQSIAQLRINFKNMETNEPGSLKSSFAYNTQQAMSNNFLFASATAELGLILRDSKFKANADLERVMKNVKIATEEVSTSKKEEFILLLEQLKGGEEIVF